MQYRGNAPKDIKLLDEVLRNVIVVKSVVTFNTDDSKETDIRFCIGEMFNFKQVRLGIKQCKEGLVTIKCNWILNNNQCKLLLENFIADQLNLTGVSEFKLKQHRLDVAGFVWVFKPIL